MEHLTMQLKDSVQRERDLTMKLIQSLQREAELTIKLQGSMQPRNDQQSLVVYREFVHTELQMIERIEFDEDANRKRELLLLENGPRSMQQSTGGVYFAWSDCLKCMKIGATRRYSPLMRLREISSYTTTPFTLIAWHPSPHPFRLEVAAHLHFREKRINARGSGAGTEFFHISAADALRWVAPLGPITLKRKHNTSTPVSASNPAAPKKKRNWRRYSMYDFVAGEQGGVRVHCRCGEKVLLTTIAEHVHSAHSASPTRVFLCGAGCGYFVTNGSRTEINKHMASCSCEQRLAQIRALRV